MIYFIQAGEGGPIKVGYVEGDVYASVELRLGLLQVGNHEELRIVATMPGGLREERALHSLFAEGHLRGEWFQADTSGLAEVIDCAERQAGVTAWQLRDDGQQLCEWCETGIVIPPRRTLCSERCADLKRVAQQKARARA